jgi:hypothetical protein
MCSKMTRIYLRRTPVGATLARNKGWAYNIGPSIKCQRKDAWFLTAKFERQYSVRNRPDGSAFWIKTILPF